MTAFQSRATVHVEARSEIIPVIKLRIHNMMIFVPREI